MGGFMWDAAARDPRTCRLGSRLSLRRAIDFFIRCPIRHARKHQIQISDLLLFWAPLTPIIFVLLPSQTNKGKFGESRSLERLSFLLWTN